MRATSANSTLRSLVYGRQHTDATTSWLRWNRDMGNGGRGKATLY